MSKIFITGGAGYIGSHVCRALAKAGHQLLVYDNLSKGHKWAIQKGAEFVQADLADLNDLESSLTRFRPDAVMHFAASIEAGESMHNPRKFFENNTLNSFNLLNICMKLDIKKFIFSSTAAVYGNPLETPINESHPLNPTNYYGWSKLFVEKILESYSNAYGLKYAALRYFNAAGASLDASLGQSYEPRTHLIGKLMEAASGKAEEFSIFGTDYKTKDGTCIRDFIHVEDLASAHVNALDYLMKGGESDVFNIGSGAEYSVKEIIDAAKRITGADFKVVDCPRREGDPKSLKADYSKAGKILKWNPVYSDINTIIKTAWEWEKNQPKND